MPLRLGRDRAPWEPHEHRRYGGSPEDPFARSPLVRHRWAWLEARSGEGLHLDIGCNVGTLAGELIGCGRAAVGVDLRVDDLIEARCRWPQLPVVAGDGSGRLPFRDGVFGSVSLLDVLEHVADDQALAREAARVLRPGGQALITVPADHVFSVLDPDNLKFRHPSLDRMIRRLLGAELGPADNPDMVGDVASVRGCHTNYEPAALIGVLENAGLVVDRLLGSGLFFRWLQLAAAVLPGRLGSVFDTLMRLDGARFCGPAPSGIRRRANMFVTAHRPG